jgi:hypothetical protein
MVKDLYHAPALGHEARTLLPISGFISQIYAAGLGKHGEKDASAVSETGRRRA